MASKTLTKVQLAEVDKIKKRIDGTGLTHNHICEQLDIHKNTLSYFLNKDPRYVTSSMTKRLKDFLAEYEEKYRITRNERYK